MSALQKALQPLSRKINNMISRAVINLVNDSEGIQIVQIGGYANEVLDKIERFQNVGFTSVPVKPDSSGTTEGIVVFPAGLRSHGIVIATDDRRFRMKDMEESESVMHNLLAVPDFIKIDKDGNIVIQCSGEVQITAPTVDITGDLEVNGAIHATGNIDGDLDIIAQGEIDDADRTLKDMVDGYNPHTHTHGAGAGTTSAPTPVVS